MKTMIIFLSREVKTGGEKYLQEVYEYFIKQGFIIVPIYLEDTPVWSRRLGLLLDCFFNNFYFLWKLKPYWRNKNIILFEDFHLHPRLVLFNFLIFFLNKHIKITGLIQSTLFYHNALKNKLLKKFDEWVVRLFFKQTDKIFCNSNFTAQEVAQAGVCSEKIKIVYCGYEESFVTSLQKAVRDKIKILFVGQCSACKGISYLLQALAILPKESFILDIVGNIKSEPDYFKVLTDLIKELSLQEQVVFHNYVSDKEKLADFYKEADIFVLPSLVEGFGIVLLEAMSFGLPIIASNAGAISELVKDGENGFLVSRADVCALNAALRRLVNSEELRKSLGENGRNFYLTNKEFYSWEKVGERILQGLK